MSTRTPPACLGQCSRKDLGVPRASPVLIHENVPGTVF